MPLYINNIKFEMEEFHSYEMKIDKEKYNLNNKSDKFGNTIPNKIVYLHSNNTSENMINVLVIRLLKAIYPIILYVDYLPFERNDKAYDSENDKYVSLKHVWKDIHYIVLGEEHSIQGIITSRLDIELPPTKSNEIYVFPDAGAERRYSTKENYIVGSKKRDSDGKLTDFYKFEEKIKLPMLKKEPEVFIIKDDICSMGGTFIKCLDALQEKYGEGKVYVLRVHYFEKGAFDKLYAEYKDINTPRERLKNNVLWRFDDVEYIDFIGNEYDKDGKLVD